MIATDIDIIRSRLDLYKAGEKDQGDYVLNPHNIPVNEDNPLRPAAVLLPVVSRLEGPRVLFTQRTANLDHHPGQVSFPGGAAERHDDSAVHTALREAQEEIGLPPGWARQTTDRHWTVASAG